VKYGFYSGCSYGSAAGYSESVDAVSRALGIELVEISDWNCCGATAFFSVNEFKALALAARNFALAQAHGLKEIVTICNACYTTFRKANQILTENPKKLSRINAVLAQEGLSVEGSIAVRHYLDVLYNDLPADVWARKRPNNLKDYTVAGYYGCQLTRPWGDIDVPEHPMILERFIERLGFNFVEHSATTLCCGAFHAVSYAKECRPLISRIIREVHLKGADMVAAVCPLCQFNLDAGQQMFGLHPVPVPFFTQLAGIALGMKPADLGLKKLLVPLRGV
jgi:heterodisulfide reductase subunit B